MVDWTLKYQATYGLICFVLVPANYGCPKEKGYMCRNVDRCVRPEMVCDGVKTARTHRSDGRVLLF